MKLPLIAPMPWVIWLSMTRDGDHLLVENDGQVAADVGAGVVAENAASRRRSGGRVT